VEFDEQWSFVKKTEALHGGGACGGRGHVGPYGDCCG
jgi:hypothetical protein